VARAESKLYVGPYQVHGLKVCSHVPEARTGGSVAKKSFDRFDAEAEREGNAISSQLRLKRPMGKRIMKIRRGHTSGQQKIQTRIERRHCNG
jgi:hypothetical protein